MELVLVLTAIIVAAGSTMASLQRNAPDEQSTHRVPATAARR